MTQELKTSSKRGHLEENTAKLKNWQESGKQQMKKQRKAQHSP
jgi:hypothetical protein